MCSECLREKKHSSWKFTCPTWVNLQKSRTVKPQERKLRVAWQVMGNTRPVRANTADRAPNTLMALGYVRILVCTVCFEWNIRTTPVHSSVHRVVTTHYGAGGYLQRTIICLRSDGQHASRTRKHCRPCAKHVHDTYVRAHTCLHGLFSVEHSYQPGTFQCTSSCNNTLRCRWVPSKNDNLLKK